MSLDGLRARWNLRRTERCNSVELGAASANAYFTSKRIRQRAPSKVRKRSQNVQHVTNDASPSRIQSKRQRVNEQEADTEIECIRKLDLPSHSQMVAELRAVDEHRIPQYKHFEHFFSTWKCELLANFNLLFYGVGSKLALLQDFASTWLSDGFVLQIHGYMPVISLKYLIETIQSKILNIDVKQNRSLSQQCRDIGELKASRHSYLVYLMVHSIDGPALRNPETQLCLSWLAQAPFIHLVASMDHINGLSIWSEEDLLRFEWLSRNIDTCQPYRHEIELKLAKCAKTADITSSGVKFILQSLTPTDVAMLQEVARQQLALSKQLNAQSRTSKVAKYAPYQSVYEACRKKLLFFTPLAFKNSVKCLEDHGLLKKIRFHTVEYLEIPLPESVVKMEIVHQ
ncbi:putative origin recognition complex, subunit 2 [Plasmopara halstedii]